MTTHTKNKRLTLLSCADIDALFGLPRFNAEEQTLYFTPTATEKMLVNHYTPIPHRVHFMLLLGYCKAKNKLFSLSEQVPHDDVHFIYHHFYPRHQPCTHFTIPEAIRKRQHQMIIDVLALKPYQQKTTKTLEKKAIALAPMMAYPVDILSELLQFLESHAILMPGYTTLQDIVSHAIITEKKRLARIYKKQTDKTFNQHIMDFILANDNSIATLNHIKQDPKNFRTNAMKKEMEKCQLLKPFYEKARGILPHLHISHSNIQYYASLIDYYPPWQLKRLQYNAWKIYLLCYIDQRYQQLNENLVTAFCYHVNKYQIAAKKYVKQKMDFIDLNQPEHKNALYQALYYYVDKSISGHIQFNTVRKKLFKHAPKKSFSKLVVKMSTELKDETYYQWEFYQKKAPKFKRNLRPLLNTLSFYRSDAYQHLLHAVDTLKNCIHENKPLSRLPLRQLPKAFIPSFYKPYIYDYRETNRKLQAFELAGVNHDRYEFLIYKMLAQAIQNYEISVHHTLQFSPYDDFIIDVNQLDKETRNILNDRIDLAHIRSEPDKIIANITDELESLYKEVNHNISTGKNQHIKVDVHREWTLIYEAIDPLPDNPIFIHFPKTHILEVLKLVDDNLHFTACFSHILNRYIKKERDDEVLHGCIVARGNNMGLNRMADASDLPYSLLKQQDAAFIRMQTLRECNDYMIECTTKLPMYAYFYIEEGVVYSSSDGSKVETRCSTIRSRYSKKYFGLGSGVSNYLFSANHLAINATVIGANESEGRYVHDFLFNNTSCIQPDIHCTDTDGTNPVNFFCLHFFKRQYAPRYRNIYTKAQHLYGTKALSSYKGLIKPRYQGDVELVKKEWANIINVLVSLGSKAISQNTLVHKLSSHAKNSKTKEAIWILNKVYSNSIMSLKN